MRNHYLKVLSLFFFLFVFSIEATIKIESDYFEVDIAENQLVASKNVELDFFENNRLFKIYSNKILYSYTEQYLAFLDGFYLSTQNVSIDIKKMSYDVLNSSVKGEGLLFFSQSFTFKSKNFDSQNTVTHFRNCEYSTCTSLDHFKLSSKHCYLYSNLNVMVALGNKVQLKGLPFDIPVPIAVVGLRDNKNHSVLPEIGKSVSEGRYIKQSVPYFLSKRSAGDVTLGFAEKFGAIVGVENIFRFSVQQQIESGYSYIEDQNNAWFLEYSYFSKKFKNRSFISLLPLYDATHQWGQSVKVSYYERQLIQDVFVNFRPKISLKNIYDNHDKKGFSLSQEMVYAKQEEFFGFNNGEIDVYQIHHKINYKFFQPYLKFQSFLAHKYYRYHQVADWERLFFGAGFLFERIFLNPEFRFVYMLHTKGESLFSFEDQLAVKENEVGLTLSYLLGDFLLVVDMDYQIESDNFRVFEYKMIRYFHCWNLSIVWDQTDDSIRFKVSL